MTLEEHQTPHLSKRPISGKLMQLWLDCGCKKAKEKKHKYHKRKNEEQATDTSAAILPRNKI